MQRSIRIRLTAFFALALVAVGFTGLRYARLSDMVLDTQYVVTAELPNSGGTFAGAEVTYRGVPVGKVTSVDLSQRGVNAQLAIRNKWRVPADVIAQVRNRSAVGEQYVDLVPTRSGPPFLRDGSRLDMQRTTVPLQEDELIATIDSFVRSVNHDDLRTVVSELGRGFAGSGDDLQRLLDGADILVTDADRNLPQTVRLLDNTVTVLRTQVDGANDLRSFADDLADVTKTLRDNDSEVRTVLHDGPVAARELTRLVNQVSTTLPALLTNLITIANVTNPHIPGLSAALGMLPYIVGAIQAIVGDGRSYLGLSLNQVAPVCQKGYIPPTQWRSTNDLSVVAPPDQVRCAEPNKNYRGTAHLPAPSGQ